MSVETVDLRNSGDTAGPKDRVVGYGSWLFFDPPESATDEQPKPNAAAVVWGKTVTKKAEPLAAIPDHPASVTPAVDGEDDFGAGTRALLDEHGLTLILLAAASIDHGLEHRAALPVDIGEHAPNLQENGACFVTLKRNGQLRGCIGSPQAHRALVLDVADNAFKAAFKDPRFPALTPGERDGLDLSIAVLSPQTPMNFADEADFMNQLRAGRDGLIIADGPRRALFLPAVWDQLPTPVAFVQHLKQKAGMAADHWSPAFQAWRFVTEAVSIDTFSGP
ncbi:MAG: AmmeMemoRadiSam system protein A [Rhodospirillaceae bacterium]|nr:AmmeMemoRadiSam system protein A [Rhodospirillaceae bacterium]